MNYVKNKGLLFLAGPQLPYQAKSASLNILSSVVHTSACKVPDKLQFSCSKGRRTQWCFILLE